VTWPDTIARAIGELRDRWSLTLDAPFDHAGASASWIAPAARSDGTRAVLKIGKPHMEAAHEIHGLRFWNGDGAVRLLEADENLNAMLLERCEAGTTLRDLPEPDQDIVIAGVLRRLWRKPPALPLFRPLSAMIEHWVAETRAAEPRWRDAGLIREGLRLMEELARPSAADVLLVTDLHAGNVLRAERAPWLAIDPKPFVGDRSYDATQHLLNCRQRMLSSPEDTIARVADLLEVDSERVRLWMFARTAAEPRDIW